MLHQPQEMGRNDQHENRKREQYTSEVVARSVPQDSQVDRKTEPKEEHEVLTKCPEANHYAQ